MAYYTVSSKIAITVTSHIATNLMDKAEERLYRLASHNYSHRTKITTMTSFLAKPIKGYVLTVLHEFLTG